MQVNDQLRERREKLSKRLTFCQICFEVTALATILNCLTVLFDGFKIFVPYSLSSVHFALEYAVNMWGKRAFMPLLAILLALSFFALYTVSIFKMRGSKGFVFALVFLSVTDVLVTAVVTIGRLQLVFYIVDLVLHLFVMIQALRAKRAVHCLFVLPEKEYEGDPFDEFKTKEE